MLRTISFNFFFFSIVSFMILSCQTEQKVRLHKYSGNAQGTYYAVTFYSKFSDNIQPEIDTFLKDFDRSVSSYQPASIISRLNNNDTTILADSIYQTVFRKAMKVSAQTDGAFDVTVGPLVNAWGFGFSKRERVTKSMVDSLLKFVGYQKVKLINGRLVKDDPSVKIDFDAIAQGYAVDLLGKFLEDKGVKAYLIDIGGEVLGKGLKPDGSAWSVAIEMPSQNAQDDRKIQAIMKLTDSAISTSGSYRKYYEENGVRFSHTIDPKTGYPVQHNLLSVSVVADNCMTADAFATSFMVFGVEKSMKFLKNHPELEAYFISAGENGSFDIKYTPGFEYYLLKE